MKSGYKNLIFIGVLIVGFAAYAILFLVLPKSVLDELVPWLNWLGTLAIAGGVIYGRGTPRAFCIGCAVTIIFAVNVGYWNYNYGLEEIFPGSLCRAISTLVSHFGEFNRRLERGYGLHVVSFLSGLCMIVIRWLIVGVQTGFVSPKSDKTSSALADSRTGKSN